MLQGIRSTDCGWNQLIVKTFALALLLLGLAVSLGCSTAPVQEMSDARQAIAAAVEAGAEDAAPRKLEAARRYLADAEKSLEERRFNTARSAALRARDRAQQARDSAMQEGQ